MTPSHEMRKKLLRIINLYNMIYDESSTEEEMTEVNELTTLFIRELNMFLMNKVAKGLTEMN